MSEDRILVVRSAYFEALSAYTQELGKTLQLLTVTPDTIFDSEAVMAQWQREKKALERLRDLRRLYAEEIAYWEEDSMGKVGVA